MGNATPNADNLVPATLHEEGAVPTVQKMNVGQYFETKDVDVAHKVHTWWDTIKDEIKHFELRVDKTVDGVVRFSKHFVEGFELNAYHGVASAEQA